MNQIYFRPATSVPEKTIRSRQRLLRSNRMIDRALREAYRKYDRSKQTQSLLRRYLIANDALTNTLTSSRSLYRVKFVSGACLTLSERRSKDAAFQFQTAVKIATDQF